MKSNRSIDIKKPETYSIDYSKHPHYKPFFEQIQYVYARRHIQNTIIDDQHKSLESLVQGSLKSLQGIIDFINEFNTAVELTYPVQIDPIWPIFLKDAVLSGVKYLENYQRLPNHVTLIDYQRKYVLGNQANQTHLFNLSVVYTVRYCQDEQITEIEVYKATLPLTHRLEISYTKV